MLRRIWNLLFGSIKTRSGGISKEEMDDLLFEAYQQVLLSGKYGVGMHCDEITDCRCEIMKVFMESHSYNLDSKERVKATKIAQGYANLIGSNRWI